MDDFEMTERSAEPERDASPPNMRLTAVPPEV